jgi:hypothetical protein
MCAKVVAGAVQRRIERRLTGTTYQTYDPIAEAFNTWSRILGFFLGTALLIMLALVIFFVVGMILTKPY